MIVKVTYDHYGTVKGYNGYVRGRADLRDKMARFGFEPANITELQIKRNGEDFRTIDPSKLNEL